MEDCVDIEVGVLAVVRLRYHSRDLHHQLFVWLQQRAKIVSLARDGENPIEKVRS